VRRGNQEEAKLSSPYLGEIRPFAFNFNPRGWFLCAGQLLSIQQYSALFSLLGTNYGGNGTTTFGLPDLRGRTPVSVGGSLQYVMGEQLGEEAVQLNIGDMPMHTHQAKAATGNGAQQPNNNAYGHTGANASGARYAVDTNPLIALNPTTIQPVGSGLPHDNMQPYLTINYCICFSGAFPPRN
jgi:microcystin-dependent protein